MVQLTQKRVTQKDIAQAADLSVAAVSMALKGNIALPASTIYRVKKIAAELGYTPDPALSALAAHRSLTRTRSSYSVLAYLIPDQSSASNDELFQEISARAAQLGFRLEAFSTSSRELSPQRLGQILTTRGIRGLILAPNCNLGKECGIDWDKFAVVALNLNGTPNELPSILPDYQEEMRLCLDMLRKSGSKKIGLVLDREQTEESNQMWQAAFQYYQNHYEAPHLSIHPVLEVESEQSTDKLRHWISRNDLDTVISNKPGIRGTLDFISPDPTKRIKLASLCCEEEELEISGIKRDFQAIGALAAETLNTLIQSNDLGTARAHISTYATGQWREGAIA